ncbi:MAG: DUF3098 domain-containing protein [Chitinophagaceae bacterium]|nr:DUF3098 domain-containing protein [Chitinophagaceae bacterium]
MSKTPETNAPASAPQTPNSNPQTVPNKNGFLFGKENYWMMLAGLAVIIIGFMLMSGGKSTDPNVFNDKELYSFRRITLAPILVLLGLAIEGYAIMKKPKNA